jgi:hypothetical protein
MTVKTITKFSAFVIVSFALGAAAASCSIAGFTNGEQNDPASADEEFSAPKELGIVASKELAESSGLAVSKCDGKLLWTHNDSGAGPYVYAIGIDGKLNGIWKVPGASAVDWEDIASGRSGDVCEIFIGDIGDNGLKRSHVSVYIVAEPESGSGAKNTKDAPETAPSRELKLTYPDGPHNAETLMFDQRTGDIYIVTKSRDAPAAAYRVPSSVWKSAGGKAIELEKVADLSLPALPPGFATGGDISDDGRRVVICDYYNAYEYSLPKGKNDLRNIWGATPTIVDVGKREQGESVAYSADANAIFLTSESRTAKTPLIEVKRN